MSNWHKRRLTLLPLLPAIAGLWLGGQGLWLYAKAGLAQYLLDDAWTATLAQQHPVRPWPWADTWPVARLRVPALHIDQIVLDGDNGRTLAFGPGHSSASALPGQPGTTLISAHRDTHFRFLRKLQRGDEIWLDGSAASVRYRVARTRVVDQHQFRVAAEGDQLVLVTCYPFDAIIPGGPLRYVVEASPIVSPHHG